MGCCFSSAPVALIDNTDGDEVAYHARYAEDEILGEGEFGVVKLVHEKSSLSSSQPIPYACKILRKGIVFKDNTLYTPLKPEILRGEIEILRRLRGDEFCLRLLAVYESSRTIYVITQYCAGGELVEYIGQLSPPELQIPDASRIAHQLLSAVRHCHQHRILHRDIKPENVMFETNQRGSNLRLIDFGSGTIDDGKEDWTVHTTFAGSAFYISPEMFQRTYTASTDVWSVGATLYVLVAGYPADDLQKAFDVLQSPSRKVGQLQRSLPNLPKNLPQSYYDLLEACLTFRYKQRPTAKELLQYEFVQLHHQQQHKQPGIKEPTTTTTTGISLQEISAVAAAASKQIEGSVLRHNLVLGFQQFERSLTALLATLLSKRELETLLQALSQRTTARNQQEGVEAKLDPANSEEDASPSQEVRLSVCKVRDIKEILKTELNNPQILETMAKIPNAELYDNFAYHTTLLGDWNHPLLIAGDGGLGTNVASLSASLGRRKGGKHRSTLMVVGTSMKILNDGSVRSTGSGHGRSVFSRMNRPQQQQQQQQHHSVSGGNLFPITMKGTKDA